mgnify:FL=1
MNDKQAQLTKPIRPVNAYVLFVKDKIAENNGAKIPSSYLLLEWKIMTEAQKAPYFEESKRLTEDYIKKKQAW